MERFKKGLILLFGIYLLSILSCTKYEEEAPFFDGLFLEYRLGGLRTIYNIHVLANHKFKIIETQKARVLSDDVEELYVDAYGRVYKSSFKPYKGKFSPIWIPVHKMEIGDTFDSGYTVARKEKWEKWEVLVIKDPVVREERYFDLNTGFWVGSFARTAVGAGKIVLINTNADIPVEE